MLPRMRSSYGFLWRDRRFGWFVLVSLLPRVGFFMLPLGILLYVRGQTGSVATAGFALGAFGLASATQPVRGRLVDRYGRLVPVALGVACAASLLLLIAAGHSRPALIGACVLAGLTLPPTGAYTRAVLTTALSGDPVRTRSAYAADSALTEGALVLGPLIVAAVVSIGGRTSTIVVSALAIEIGTIALSLTTVARTVALGEPAASAGVGAGGAAEGRGTRTAIRIVLGATLCVTVALGVVDVAVPVFALRHGSVADAGLLLGVLAAGTALGALWCGSHPPAMALERQMTIYTAPLVACIGAMALVNSPLLLGALLVLTGFAIGPLYVVLYALIEQSVSAGDRTRAFAWEVTVTNTGAAVGSAAAGVIIAGSGLHAALGVAAAAVAVGLAVGLALVLSPIATPAHNPAQS